jgi:nicotinate-nucleotide pyrophosphorylase (carboxylating)
MSFMLQAINDISKDPEVLGIINKALVEDIGSGDHSSLSCIPGNKVAVARLIFKDYGVAAGLNIAYTILRLNDPDCKIDPFLADGDIVNAGDIAFEVTGNAHSLLKSERLLLNIMQRLSGIATVSRLAANKVKNYGTRILDTRKTTPNLRIMEKWAVRIGGAFNHRMGLYDMIMLKDNHIDVAGGIVPAIKMAKEYLEKNKLSLGVEVETRSLKEVAEAITQLPFQRIMLDNFTPDDAREAVQMIAGRCETEASGGITLENIDNYASAGVDFISLGMLTHSVKSLDISFKIRL